MFVVGVVIGYFVDDFHDLLEKFHGVLFSYATDEDSASEVGCELDDVALFEPDLGGVLVSELALEELLGESALDVEALVVAELGDDFGEDLAEPGRGEKLRDNLAVLLELVWQPGDHGLLERDHAVRVEQTHQLVVDDVLVEGQLHILAEFIGV